MKESSKIISILLSVTVVISCLPFVSYADTSSDTKYRRAMSTYNNFLEKMETGENSDGEWYFNVEEYALYDLNNDKVPELITHGGGQSDYSKIYSCYDGQIVNVHWGSSFDMFSNGIIEISSNNGYGAWTDSFYRMNGDLELEYVYAYTEWLYDDPETFSEDEYSYDEDSERVDYEEVQNHLSKVINGSSSIQLKYNANTESNRKKSFGSYTGGTDEYREDLGCGSYNYIRIKDKFEDGFLAEIFFLRLTGTNGYVYANFINSNTAEFYDDSSNLSGKLTLKGKKVILDLDEVEDYYFDDDLSLFVNGLHHEFAMHRDGNVPKLKHMNLNFNSNTKISFDWGTDLLKGNAAADKSFSIDLAKAAIYLCEGTYNGQQETEKRMKTLGFSEPTSEYYTIDAQTNTSPITVASDVAEIGGTEYLIIAAAVRGTQDDGWDFVTDLRSGLFNVDGFAEAGETGMEVVKNYWNDISSETGIGKDHTILFVTGHSLGGAIAGQIAGNLQNEIALKKHIFSYTFASPFYETHKKDINSFTNIHNIINTQDAVPKFPIGGVRYGKSHNFTGNGKDVLDQHMLGTYLSALKKASPPKTAITSVSKGKKSFTVKWKKKAGISGYQVQYGTKSTFKGAKTVSIKKPSTTKKIVKKLKSKKKYYVRVRTYRKIFGYTYYSEWSTKKGVKTK